MPSASAVMEVRGDHERGFQRRFSEEICIIRDTGTDPLKRSEVRLRPVREFVSEVTLLPCMKPQHYRKAIRRPLSSEPTQYETHVFLMPGRRPVRFGQSIRFPQSLAQDREFEAGSESDDSSVGDGGSITMTALVDPPPRKDVKFKSSVSLEGSGKMLQLHIDGCHTGLNSQVVGCGLNGDTELW